MNTPPALFSLFNSIHPLPQDFWTELKDLVQGNKYGKRTILLKEGDVCNDIYFLISGFARAYHFKDGEYITSWFMKDGDVIISVQSFLKQEKSLETIELLEDSEVMSLSYTSLQYLYRKYPDFNFVGRVLTEHYYIQSEQRGYSLRMHSAYQRYENLLTSHPEIFQRAQLKYVASYLGMKPETLSRIRAKRE